MAQKYGFFNSVNNDRVYDAADVAGFLSKFFTNGIFNNSLAVNSNDNMTISISTGSANINGYGYENTDILTFDIEEADSELNRIDSVIVRLDLTNRQITTMILEGAYATTPSQPNIIRSGNIYDLRLANISVPSGTTRITKDLITDTRFSGDCGNVIQAIQSPDLTEMLEKCTEQVQNAVNNIKGILDGNIAGNLINSINDINDKLITTEICTNEEIQTALNNVNENSNDVLKDNKENILDPIIPRYEVCKYNLITDGPAVKTGRKVDGKWEWARRYSINIGNAPGNYGKDSELVVEKIIFTFISGTIVASPGNVYELDTANYKTGSNYLTISPEDNKIHVITQGEYYDNAKAYIEIHYLENEESST